MIGLFATLAMTAASADQMDIKQLSVDFYNLELARFKKKLPLSQRVEARAERIAKKAGCKLPSDIGWVHARVDVALEVSPEGRLTKVVPVETGCQPLEAYVIKYMLDNAGHDGAVIRNGNKKWYRQAITFRWPE